MEGVKIFVTAEVLKEFTGKERPSAQARFLRARFPTIVFIIRDDGTIALRQEEFDRYTLSKPAPAERRAWQVDLSQFNEPRQRRRKLDLSLLRKKPE